MMKMLRATGTTDFLAALTLDDWDSLARLLRDDPGLIDAGGMNGGALHLMAKQGNLPAVQWLLDHGANANARWSHFGIEVTPLHLAVWQGRVEIVQLLLRAGADPHIRDSAFDSDAKGWAEHNGQAEIVRILGN
jgi:ankyrin repeat protein